MFAVCKILTAMAVKRECAVPYGGEFPAVWHSSRLLTLAKTCNGRAGDPLSGNVWPRSYPGHSRGSVPGIKAHRYFCHPRSVSGFRHLTITLISRLRGSRYLSSAVARAKTRGRETEPRVYVIFLFRAMWRCWMFRPILGTVPVASSLTIFPPIRVAHMSQLRAPLPSIVVQSSRERQGTFDPRACHIRNTGAAISGP